MKNVILSEAKDLKWPKNEILRYTQNDKKREKCFFTQSDCPLVSQDVNDIGLCNKKKGTGQGDGSFFPSHHSLPIDKMEFDGTRTPVP